jgi:pyruvate dehydrogenase E1 component alpha subunit
MAKTKNDGQAEESEVLQGPGGDGQAPVLDRDEAADLLAVMWRIRRFEEKVDDLFARGLLHGTMHLSIGQEASATGAVRALRDDAYVTSTHRGHGHCIAKGADVMLMLAELLGRENGYCRGRGGSMHIADVEAGNLGANGIVAGSIPIAAGAALALRMQGRDSVVLCFFGDGAVNEGGFHEAVNIAAIWKLPVIFLCENNHYGMSMAVERSSAVLPSQRGAGYGVPGVSVDGNDLLAVREAVAGAAVRARAGEGPSIVEAVTYRYKGHSKSDQNRYRTREEIQEWRERDPIRQFAEQCVQRGWLDGAQADRIRDAVTAEIEDALDEALKGPEPSLDRIEEDVYA